MQKKTKNIIIAAGEDLEINEGFKKRVLDIYFDAFGRKILTLMRPEARAREIMGKAIDFGNAFYAIDDEGTPLGFIGYQAKKIVFTAFRFSYFKEHYNFLSAFFKFLMMKIFSPKVKEKEIRIDAIAVTRELRGKKIGSLLLDHFISHSASKGFRKVILEVVDTNPLAKKLYERIGFRVTRTIKYYFITRNAGFSAEDIMVLDIK